MGTGSTAALNGGLAWTDGTGTSRISPAAFLGYGGGGIAILLSIIGALQNAGQLLVSVEDGLDTWLGVYEENGDLKSYIQDAENSSSMETFLTAFTWDIIFFSTLSLIHSMWLMTAGFLGAWMINTRISSLETAAGAGDVSLTKAFKTLVFGVVLGSVDYMAGNVTKNLTESVFLSLGFTTHEYDSMDSAIETTTITNPAGVTSTFTTTADTVEVDYDFVKLLKMQDNWFNFFAIQRGTQLAAPYLYIGLVDSAIVCILFLATQFM